MDINADIKKGPEASAREAFMGRALEQAHIAALLGEVPVGAVIVREGRVIAESHNRCETGKNALYHAETRAIQRACAKLGGWRLPGCELYVTMEPCIMCAGAIINSRIEAVYFGASDPRFGACGSMTNVFSLPSNHRPRCEGGLLESECSKELKTFFKDLRVTKEIDLKFRRYARSYADEVSEILADESAPYFREMLDERCKKRGASIRDSGLLLALYDYPMVAIAGGEVVGVCTLERGGRIGLVAVRRDMRRKGIGRRLIGTVELKSRIMGWSSIWGRAMPEHEPFLNSCKMHRIDNDGEKYLYKKRF